MVLYHVVGPRKPMQYRPNVRVDLVGLPDIKKSDATLHQDTNADFERMKQKLAAVDAEIRSERARQLKNPSKQAVEPAFHPTKAATMGNPNRKKELSRAIDRIRSLQALKESIQKSAPAKGNIMQKGSVIGDSAGNDPNIYIDNLVARIRDNWDLPLWLANKGLSAKVVLHLNHQGQIAQVVFTQSSGNEQFDQVVRNTIQKSTPFAAPPPDEIISDGLMLGFPL